MFDRAAVLKSSWYGERLRVKQQRDIALWKRHVATLEEFSKSRIADGLASADGLNVADRLREAREQLARVSAVAYLAELQGTIGADPFTGQLAR